MADHDLITAYLARLRQELKNADDIDDVIDEVTDHLLSTVERLVTSGTKHDAAHRAALEEFGDPRIVGQLLISAQHQGVIMPTTFTVRAGYLGMIALFAAIVTVAFLTLTARAEQIYEPALAESRWAITYGFWMGTMVLLVIAAWGVATRVGLGATAKTGATITTLGLLVATSPWMAPIWATLITVGILMLAIQLLRTDKAFKVGAWVAIGGTTIMSAAIWGGVIHHWLKPTFPEPSLVGWAGTAGLIILAAGFAIVGRIMASEPVTAPAKTAVSV